MGELSSGSPPNRVRVNYTIRSNSPSILDLDSPDNSVLEPEVFIEQDASVTSGSLLHVAPEEIIEDTNDSNSIVIYNVDNDAAVPSLANMEEPLPEVVLNSSPVQLNNDNSMNSDANTVVLSQHAEVDDNVSECRDEEPPAKVRRIGSPKSDELDAETCPICLDTWGNTGEHRLVALRCGHLFGSLCVEKWLKAQKIKERSCPTCKTRASLRDLRYIYARRLVAADTSQITVLQKQVDTLQAEKSKAELELQKTKIAHRACCIELEVLRNTLMKSYVKNDQPARKSWRFALEKNLEICKDGGCRVMTYNCRTYELYVTQKGYNYLFPGYGIRKVSCVDYKLGQFLHLHQKPIRDITYSQPKDLLLSVGLDSTARIVERGIRNVVVNAGMPLWSCSWDYLRSNEFYVGGVGGIVHQYDVRNPGTYLQILNSPGDMSPIVSLCSTEYGLLCCQLNSCHLWVSNMRQWVPRSLPVSGSFVSLCYDSESHRVCVTSRPSVGSTERSKLTLCRLKSSVGNSEVLCDVEESFPGSWKSTIMSRSTWVRTRDAAWVAAHSESEATLQLYGVEGSRSMSLPASEPALDVAAVDLNGNTILGALSASRLRLYKAVSTDS